MFYCFILPTWNKVFLLLLLLWLTDQRKHQSFASLAFVRGIHRGPVNSPHRLPVTRKMFPFDNVSCVKVIMTITCLKLHSNMPVGFAVTVGLVFPQRLGLICWEALAIKAIQWRHMGILAIQITGNSIVCSTDCTCLQHRTHKCSAWLTLCEGNPWVTGMGDWLGLFPSQSISNAEIVSISWRREGNSNVKRSRLIGEIINGTLKAPL